MSGRVSSPPVNLLRPAPLLALVAAGCADAHAQLRPDAGARGRWLLRDSPPLHSPFGDAGIPPAFLGPPGDVSDAWGSLAGTATTTPAAPAGDAGAGRLGTPPSDGRFGDPERLGGIALPDARSWLAVAGGWAHRCLERARDVAPFEAPVRFTVARDGSVSGVTAEGAPEGGQRCLVEGFGHVRFRPIAQPAELVARYRYTVRLRPTRTARDAGADG